MNPQELEKLADLIVGRIIMAEQASAMGSTGLSCTNCYLSEIYYCQPNSCVPNSFICGGGGGTYL